MTGDIEFENASAIPAQPTDCVVVWTVYDHPKDYPDDYVARPFVSRDGRSYPTAVVLRARTLDALRAKLPRGLVRFARSPSDDAVILESWL